MSNLIDLFSVLDSWDETSIPPKLELSPDSAIRDAKNALSGNGNVVSALKGIEEEIDKARPMLRALRFDLVQEVHSELGWSPNKAKMLACELHQLAALLLMRLRRFDEASSHLIRSISCLPENPNPRLHFVELYSEMGAYSNAFDLLEREVIETPNGVFQLYQLSKDIHESGELQAAKKCYERIIELDRNGLFSDLARLQITNINLPKPSVEYTESLYQLVDKQLQVGNVNQALMYLRKVLCWYPESTNSWYLMGYAYSILTHKENQQLRSDSKTITLRPVILGSERYDLLQKATEAFRIVVLLDPKFIEAHTQLASCYIFLELPGAALKSILTAAEEFPDDPEILANLSVILFMNGDLVEAWNTATVALAIDPQNDVARNTIAILEKTKDIESKENVEQ